MDTVYIRELRIDTIIGIHDWERRVRQTLVFDVELATDAACAAASDAIEDAVDYHTVGTRLGHFVADSEFHLVETLAERCAALIMKEFGVPWLRLRVSKPGALGGARDVGVVIERGKKPRG